MYKLTFIGLLLLITTFAVTPVFAKRYGWIEPGGHGQRNMEHLENLELLLDLTPVQAEEIEQIVNNRRKATEAERQEASEIREEIQHLLKSDDLNEDRLKELVHKQAERKANRMISRHETKQEIDTLLTQEQREKRDALRAMKKHRKRDRHGLAANWDKQQM